VESCGIEVWDEQGCWNRENEFCNGLWTSWEPWYKNENGPRGLWHWGDEFGKIKCWDVGDGLCTKRMSGGWNGVELSEFGRGGELWV